MRKYLLAVITCMAITVSNAQNITDAVMFSSEGLQGTARFKAMSGAFGALGGDLSAMNINPAGSAVFNTSFATLTLGLDNTANDVGYNNGLTSNSNSIFDVPQGGAALVFLNKDENSSWKKLAVGFNYNKINSLADEFVAHGSSSTSIDNYFLEYAQGVPLNLLNPMDNESVSDLYSYLGETQGYGAQQAFLGYQAYIINPENDSDPDNTNYFSAVAAGNFDQRYSYISTGLNGKFAFNVATQYNDNLFLGINLNSHFINHERYTNLYEQNSNAGSETNVIEFENNFTTLGTGFSFQLGGIAKLNQNIRIGAAFESPTWLTISEETVQSLGTYSEMYDETVIVQPNVINVFPEYRITTPAKYTGSLGYIFGPQGLISFDYSYKDYSSTTFRPKNDAAFAQENNIIEQNLKAASTYRLGAEYRIQEISLRGGYRYEESPYGNESIMGNLSGYSLGLGYDFGKMKLDFAFDSATQERQHQLYAVGLTNIATVDRNLSSYTLSLSFGL